MDTLQIKWRSKKGTREIGFDDNNHVQYSNKRDSTVQRTIPIHEVTAVVAGADSDYWRRSKRHKNRNCGIEVKAHRNLRMEALSHDEWKYWMVGLLYAQARSDRKKTQLLGDGGMTDQFMSQQLIRAQWDICDVNNSGSICFFELLVLLKALNIHLDVGYIEFLFHFYDSDGSKVLSFPEFRSLMTKLFTHQPIFDLFMRYRNAATGCIDNVHLEQWLRDDQKDSPDVIKETCRTIALLSFPFNCEKGLTGWGLNLIITGGWNSLIDPKFLSLNHDMTQPLTNYWINTSHNTYLSGNQIGSKATIHQYIICLMTGTRCLELDIWDGPGGSPLIYHGHTLTSKIPLASVLKAIDDYAFIDRNNPWPVILSLEMHTGIEQTTRVAHLIKTLLGDRVYIWNEDDKENVDHHAMCNTTRGMKRIPSPQELCYRFIIKARRSPSVESSATRQLAAKEAQPMHNELILDSMTREFPDLWLGEPDTKNNVQLWKHTHITDCGVGPLFPFMIPDITEVNMRLKAQTQSEQLTARDSARLELGLINPTVIDLNMNGLESVERGGGSQDDFNQLITMETNNHTEWNHNPEKRGPLDCTSLSERKAIRCITAYEPHTCISYTMKNVVRVYPGGSRLNSSNFSPIPFWESGVQMCALNHQTDGIASRVNQAFFLMNANSGYLLKNQCYLNPEKSSVTETPWNISIRVLSGRQIPRPPSYPKRASGTHNKSVDQTNPYVVLMIHGSEGDNREVKTHYVPGNGLNPNWGGEPFEFCVKRPSLAFLCLSVRHYDVVKSEFLGAFYAPVQAMRQGIRWCELATKKGVAISHSGVIVEVNITDGKPEGTLGSDKPTELTIAGHLTESDRISSDASMTVARDSEDPLSSGRAGLFKVKNSIRKSGVPT
eukprot:GHVH01001197.1.p1 GENE.GHVH01001197.1~~GHVH01001197.1.p1  ORF type:complete len:1016 (+),score=160.07 GHVH01001197.1:380-3049(+)